MLIACSVLAVGCGPDSKLLEARLNSAQALYHKKDLDGAFQIVIDVIDQDPGNSTARMMAARIEFYRSNSKEAEKHCRAILDNNSEHYGALLWLARILSGEKGRVLEAQGLIDRALLIDTRSPEIWYLKGLLHEKKGELAEAIAAYNAGIYSSHHIGNMHLRLADLYGDAKIEKRKVYHLNWARIMGGQAQLPE